MKQLIYVATNANSRKHWILKNIPLQSIYSYYLWMQPLKCMATK